MKVALVGPCGVGKSTIAALLEAAEITVAQPAQEHSGIPDMWQRLTRPDVLVYLDASLTTLRAHRPSSPWTPERLLETERRLAHARAHADLVIAVDGLTPSEVTERVRDYLDGRFRRPL
jgi:hypothetical protein